MHQRSHVTTKYGRVEVVATDARHLYLNASSNALGDPEVGLIINGVRYAASLHVNLYDGVWEPSRDAHGNSYHALYLSRADRLTSRDASDSARRKATEILLAVAREWAAANPDLINAAEEEHVAEQISRREEKIAEKEAEIATLRGEIQELRHRYNVAVAKSVRAS